MALSNVLRKIKACCDWKMEVCNNRCTITSLDIIEATSVVLISIVTDLIKNEYKQDDWENVAFISSGIVAGLAILTSTLTRLTYHYSRRLLRPSEENSYVKAFILKLIFAEILSGGTTFGVGVGIDFLYQEAIEPAFNVEENIVTSLTRSAAKTLTRALSFTLFGKCFNPYQPIPEESGVRADPAVIHEVPINN
jgi:hypothetical protein